MTIGAIIVCIIITIMLVGFCSFLVGEGEATILGAIIGLLISALLWGGCFFFYNHTEKGKRAMKSQDANLNGGITRQVLVYDMDGDLIAEYTGKFDVDYSNERIMFDDENGQRHIIYFKSGTVIVDEIGKE